MSSIGEQFEISNVLIATDGSAHAEAATEYGAALAVLTGAEVRAIYVTDSRRLAGPFIKHFAEFIGNGLSSGFLTRAREYYRTYGLRVL
jgi:nucleotide-binding universal stress UspA family protein